MKRQHSWNNTQTIEVTYNLNKLTIQERVMLQLYFVHGLPKTTLKFIFKKSHKDMIKRFNKIIKGIVS